MKYYVQRQLNEYGPYTLADLQRYIAQGNILLTDLTRSEGMTDWVPVSQVIGNIPVPVPPAAMQFPGGPTYGGGGTVYGEAPTYGGQAVAPLANAPVPPDFHWALVLVISIVTCGLFGWAWLFVEAAYVKKIKQDSKGLLFDDSCVPRVLHASSVARGDGFRAVKQVPSAGYCGWQVLFFALSACSRCKATWKTITTPWNPSTCN